MPWTVKNYPASMKNLEERVRNKAIDIANALLDDGYEEGRAIPIAIAQAKKWVDNDYPNLHVIPHPRGWAIRREGSQRVSFVMDTKEAARNRALEIAKEDGIDVVIHDENGRIEHYVDVLIVNPGSS